jgi:predicted amidohydrolase
MRDPREPLVVAVAQPACTDRDIAANALAHAAAVRGAHARVVVFPELSLTGYHYDAPAIDADDPRLEPLVAACAETSTIALAGVPVRDDAGGAHVAIVAVDDDGVTVPYRKIWLDPTEAGHYVFGTALGLLVVDGWRLGLSICRDTGIAEHVAATVGQGIDVFVAGILDEASERARHHERYRRIAHQHRVWVAIASFAGSTGAGYTHAMGGSGIWAPGGELVAVASSATGEIARATLTAPAPVLA